MYKSLTRRYAGTLLSATLLSLTAGCTKDSATVSAADVEKDTPVAVSFDTYLQNSRQSTRATYPAASVGMIDDAKLKTSGFGVFAQYTENTPWDTYNKEQAFNFMWNQQVDWTEGSSAWTYSPVKYWPNDNQPADDQGAQGSVARSYLSFFGYAPYVQANSLPPTGRADATADGIIEMTTNNTAIDGSYLYYRTSIEKPFGEDKSVDLLWATRRNCYKYDSDGANDDGRVTDQVNLLFKHALTKLDINVCSQGDRPLVRFCPFHRIFSFSYTLIVLQFNSAFAPFYPSLSFALPPIVVRLLSVCCSIVVRLTNGQQTHIKCSQGDRPLVRLCQIICDFKIRKLRIPLGS